MADIIQTEFSDAKIDAAIGRGKAVSETAPRAATARYDRQRGRVIVELTSGCAFAFPPRLAQGLERATEEQLEQVEILGRGYGLHWEALDADLSVPGLLAGIFGTRSYMAARAGKVSSPAKSAAARRNGAKGGRPRKPLTTDH
jgi:hypothetical protein